MVLDIDLRMMDMFRSIRWRIALPYVGLILITMLALGVYLSSFLKQTYISDLESKLTDEARMIGDIIITRFANRWSTPKPRSTSQTLG